VPRPRTARRAALVGAFVLAVGPLATPVAAEEPLATQTVVGELVRVQAEPRSPEEATALHEEPLTYVEPAQGAAVRLTGAEAEELPVGATVEVRVGDEVSDAPAAEGGIEPAREVLAAEVVAPAEQPPVAPAGPPHTNEVTVALVAPPGTTATSTTVAEVKAVVAGAVADYWERESYGAITIGVAATDADNDWYESTVECEDYAALWSETADRVGFVPGAGRHLLLYLPPTGDVPFCEYGLGTIGNAPSTGGAAYVRDLTTSVIAHELGHNFGLGHSSLMQCDRAIEGVAVECGVFPYYDLYEVMGFSEDVVGSLSALHGRLLGVLPDEHVHLVEATDATRDYVLSPISSRTGYAGIRLDVGGFGYWLEYRTAIGQDAWLADDPTLETGVQLRVEEDFEGDTSLLLDGTPSAAPWDTDLQTQLPPRQSFWLAGGAFQVTVKSATDSQAVVRVATLDGVSMPRDLDEDFSADVLAVDSTGVLWNYGATGTGGIAGRARVGGGWQARDVVVSTGDLDGDDVHDVLAREPRTGNLWFYAGTGTGGLRAVRVLGGGWNAMNALLSPGDLSGDGIPDLMARTRADGVLWMYPGTGTGRLGPRVRLGGGWGTITALAATGDLDLNGTVDFLARRQDGSLMLYSGNGRGGLAPGLPRRIGGGWQGMTGLSGPGDWSGDGVPDLLARKSDGSLMLYRGTGAAAFTAPIRLGGGWNPYRLGI
jgi:Metallo-peptidase family M12B Reprolysin-like